jgi:hypothetical protein
MYYSSTNNRLSGGMYMSLSIMEAKKTQPSEISEIYTLGVHQMNGSL